MAGVRVEGLVGHPRDFGPDELAGLPGQVVDVSARVPGRHGQGVELASVLAAVEVEASATHLLVESLDGSFRATLPLEAVSQAILLHSRDGGPLAVADGGPIRFLTPHPGGCDKRDGHACANVKGLGRLELRRDAAD